MESRIPNPKVGSCIVEKNKWLFCGSTLLAALLCLGTVSAKANEPSLTPPYLVWACWMGDELPINIICIHNRSQIYHVAPDDPGDKLEAAILDQIYERILNEKTSGLEAFLRTHKEVLRKDKIWFIPIWSKPYEQSWDESRPQRLVAVGLCPRNTPCVVILRRPTP